MTKRVQFKAKDGSDLEGELAEPSGSGKVPAVVLIQEWWGVNDHIRDLCTRLSNEGFLVVAPDLYHGKTTKDPSEAGRLMTQLDTHKAVEEIGAAVEYLKAHERGNGKVGVIGFCMGGALTFASACHLEDRIAAAVPFYGIPPAEKVDYDKVKAPILAHFAKRDEWAAPAQAEKIKKKLEARNHPMELHVYDADHAFVNDTRPEVYNSTAAKLAWERTVEFLKKHVS